LYRKGGKESKLSYMGHVLTENRHGLVVDARLTQATGYAEREAALSMLEEVPGDHHITLGADKGYDTRDFIEGCRELNVTPHVAQNTTNRSSRIDERTTRHAGYAVSQRRRKQIEEVFGWMKTIGGVRKVRHRGRENVDWIFTLTVAVYNLTRIRNLCPG
jgi:IS5 family transposase